MTRLLPHVHLGPLRAPSYAVLLALAIALGLAICRARAERDGGEPRRAIYVGIAGVLGGFAGAKLWSIALESRLWLAAPQAGALEAIWSTSGMSIVGGLLGGFAGAALGSRSARVDLLAWIDSAAPGVAAAIALARIGCLLAGCCYGEPTLFRIAIVYEDWDAAARPIGVPLHATQIYESIACALLAIALWRLPPLRGLRAGAFFAGYGAARIALEQLRADPRGWLWGMPATMIGASALAFAGVVLLGLVWRRQARPGG